MPRRMWSGVVALLLALWPKDASLSGPVTLEHRTRHFELGMVSGPSIEFLNEEDERHHHESERERLRPELERIGDELEAALGGVERKLVLDYAAGPEVGYGELLNDIERDLASYDYSPYALHLLREAQRAAQPADTSTWDGIMASPFTLVFRYTREVGAVDVRVRVTARPSRASLARLERAVRGAVKPSLRPLRLAGEARPDNADGFFWVRTRRVEVRLVERGTAVPALKQLARQLAHRIDAEIGRVKDDWSQEIDRGFEVTIARGGFRPAETPLGGGFTSPFLAEVPAEVELDVRLRTVESDNGGSLDRALVQRLFELARKEIPGLKRHDSPQAVDEIGADDWVLVHKRS